MKDHVVVLTGGVGGAKFVLGLAQLIAPSNLTAIVNVGDDFRHLGLHVSPDIDTLLYTLSGKANAVQGWGREGESWSFMQQVRSLGGEDWFALGDGDLALHVLRSERLQRGHSLSRITADFASGWGIKLSVLPASDQLVSTVVETDEGALDFQHYFVARRCEPRVHAVRFDGADRALPAPGVLEAIGNSKARAIFIAPSNPYLSIDPILAVPGIREALSSAHAPIVAISPVVGGKAVKGPTAKLMKELGLPVTPATIAAHYAPLLDGLLKDERDVDVPVGIPHVSADTLMLSLHDRIRVAGAALDLADRLV